LKTFFRNPGNKGISLGLAFFPVLDPGAKACVDACVATSTSIAIAERCLTDNCSCNRFVCYPAVQDCQCQRVSCNASDYETPVVPISPLPDAADLLSAKLDEQEPDFGTPTTPSIQGALNHARAWASAHVGKRMALVFATDGEPAGCSSSNNTIDTAAAAAKAAFEAVPSIPTYVIGIGPQLANLNQLAQQGGTGAAYIITPGADVAKQFADALNAVRSRTATCNYVLPKNKNIDPRKVNVRLGLGMSAPVSLAQVAGLDKCDALGGWYYDDPVTPTLISLCPATCEAVKAAGGSSVQVLLGCNTIVR
jgi:hypothetical protein